MKAFRPLVFTSLIVFAANVALADIPASYYSSLTGKKDGELKTATCNLIRNFQKVSSYNALPSYFVKTDVYPESSRWWDM